MAVLIGSGRDEVVARGLASLIGGITTRASVIGGITTRASVIGGIATQLL